MVDDSEMEYLATMLNEATTNLTVSNIKLVGNIMYVSGDKKALIFPPQIMLVDGHRQVKRFLVKISMETEENLMSIINEIINGCYTYNSTRSGFTNVASMDWVQLAYTGKIFIEANGRANVDCWIDVEFNTY